MDKEIVRKRIIEIKDEMTALYHNKYCDCKYTDCDSCDDYWEEYRVLEDEMDSLRKLTQI